MGSVLLTQRLIAICLFAVLSLEGMTASVAANAKDQHCCVFMNASTITEVRDALKKNTAGSATKQAYKKLISDANKALKEPVSTVTDKALTPSSGDKHDYMSIGAYWWPDNKKPDGKPWIRKDGQVNPATKNDQTDAERFAKFTSTAHTLALAGFMSGDNKYNVQAARLLKAWFIDPDTKMNPHLKYAQSIPGKEDGRAEGVLDGRLLATRILDTILLVQKTSAWSQDDDQKMRAWMEAYFVWLTTSKTGQAEGKADNNHGTWYNLQAAGIARFLGKDEVARDMINKTKHLIDKQIAADGAQPLELARPRSFHYSYFNLQPLVMLAAMGTELGIDIWHYTNSKGGSIQKALDYMAPYANPAKKWPHKNTERESLPLIPLLILADNSLKSSTYQQLIKAAKFDKVPSQDTDGKMGNVKLAERESWLMNLPHSK
jgi:hypothetical protein